MASDYVGWAIGAAALALAFWRELKAREARACLRRIEEAIVSRAESDPETAERVEKLRSDEGWPTTADKEALADAIAELPEREKLIVTLYYYEQMTMKEIGEVLGVSPSRVSQLHTKAILRLKARLGDT